MTGSLRTVTRIALCSALIYVLSWATVYLPNVSFVFFIVFTAGFLWGIGPGMLVGLIGMGLWTAFNPYGPAHLYIMLAQMLGASTSGLIGHWVRKSGFSPTGSVRLKVKLALSGAMGALLYFLPVSVLDAWLFQPFWPRMIVGMPWIGLSVGANMLIFVTMFPITLRLYERERMQ